MNLHIELQSGRSKFSDKTIKTQYIILINGLGLQNMSRILAIPLLAIIISLSACGSYDSRGTSETDYLPTLAPTESSATTTEDEPGYGTLSLPETGTEEGKAAPHFAFKLADGSEQSTTMLAEQSKPAFLFFFTTS